MEGSRRLVAIMFTDIVGYTSMMGSNEELAITTVTHHKKIIEQLVPQYGGEVIQFYGDGSLSIYPSAVLALECGENIQKELKKEIKVPLRIGIHIGDILFKDGNIYGDGVNLASRIESLGEAGSVLFSNEVFLKVRNNPKFLVQLLGEFELKNVEAPMSIYALSNEGLSIPLLESKKRKSESQTESSGESMNYSEEKSIAVLPFENQSSIEDHQFFINGIADEIRSQLLSINDLKVISRRSCMFFKDRPYTLNQIKDDLGVNYVLEGRVQVFHNQIKVSVELSDTITDKQLWSLVPANQSMDDIFILQNNIAQKVVNELKVALSDVEKIQLTKIPTLNHKAYNYYQKGQDLLHRGGGQIDQLDEALSCFKQSIELDPKFSMAYVGLSDTYLEYIFWGRTAPSQVLEMALNACLKALELDNTKGECYGTLGAINYYKFKKEAAFSFLRKAIDLNPYDLEAYENLGCLYITENKQQDAVAILEKAHSTDPLSTKYLGDIGHVFYYSHQFEEGIQVISKTIVNNPKENFLLWMLGLLYSGAGNYEKAIDCFLQRTKGRETNWMLAYCYSKSGNKKGALKILDIHLKKRETQYIPSYMIASIYMGLGDKEKALHWLETDQKEGGTSLFYWGLKDDPKFEEIMQEERFKKLMIC
jgi:class 3 adenylate cyclase/Flp pilus assembly protein TadD